MFHNRCLIATLVAGLLASSSSAAVLLTVDASNPSAVVFTSTGGTAGVTYSATGGGLLMHGAMASDGNTSLQTPGQPDPLREFVSGSGFVNYGDEGDAIRVIVSGNAPHAFTSGTQALIGTTTVDLSFLNFAHTDFVGDIEIRNVNGQATGIVIGQFQFDGPSPIPEPTTLGLLGAVGTIALRRRNAR